MITKKRTKIIATLGPSTKGEKIIETMIDAGVNVFRINFSHADYDSVKEDIAIIQKAREKKSVNIGILADLQGPKLRTGLVKENVFLKSNSYFNLITSKDIIGDETQCSVSYDPLAKDVNIGEKILIDDGKIILEVVSSNGSDNVTTKVIQGGELKSKKGVNLPYTKTSVPALTEKDKKDVAFAIQEGIDWIALSFVRKAEDIVELKNFILKYTSLPIPIIAKIEKPEAIENIKEIMTVCSGVMVARGDLGVEIPAHKVPLIQKELVTMAKRKGIPVIIATQMIETMIDSLTPTRAEVSDVANAVIDSADAVMVSGETSVGKYPVEVIETLCKILKSVENYDQIPIKREHPKVSSKRLITKSICYYGTKMAKKINAKAICTLTNSGYTAFQISSWRPNAEILVFTSNKNIINQLSLIWGVSAFFYDKMKSTDETISDVNKIASQANFLSKGDLVINLSSMPIFEKGIVNTLRISCIGED